MSDWQRWRSIRLLNLGHGYGRRWGFTSSWCTPRDYVLTKWLFTARFSWTWSIYVRILGLSLHLYRGVIPPCSFCRGAKVIDAAIEGVTVECPHCWGIGYRQEGAAKQMREAGAR